jgi:hypothetical protein
MSAETSAGSEQDPHHGHHGAKTFWLWAMCLTGVDYFSTLGYQPSIAFTATGYLCPIATVVVVAVTLFGALPVYSYIAKRSYSGLGSIGLLEKLLHGWPGKVLVLVLLGFAATDFVITKTLSAADAASHVLSNPLWPFKTVSEADQKLGSLLEAELLGHDDGGDQAENLKFLNDELEKIKPGFSGWDLESRQAAEREALQDISERTLNRRYPQQMALAMGLLVLLGGMFLRGFKEVIGLAVFIVLIYLVLNILVIGFGLRFLMMHPEYLEAWFQKLQDPTLWFPTQWQREHMPSFGSLPGFLGLALTCMLLFPKLALGLSGFETGVAIMPLIKGGKHDTIEGRIRATRMLLVTAALIMSVMLLGSSLVVTTLIPASELVNPLGESFESKAKDRALAYLAHGESPVEGLNAGNHPLFGQVFGTIYDLSTIVILWFAGASAMAALLNLVPQYLPRYGMAPQWTQELRKLVILFTLINLFVTWVFDARVDKQGNAYATGVLVLILSACIASVIQLMRERPGNGWVRRFPWYFGLVTAVFAYTLLDILVEKPEGLKIATGFIFTILAVSFLSRVSRTTELRFEGFQYVDENSQFLYESLLESDFHLVVPHRPGRRDLSIKEETIRREHHLDDREDEIVFLEMSLGDVSDFLVKPMLKVVHEDNRWILSVNGCASIPHVIAGLTLEMAKRSSKPLEIHFGWSDESPLIANLKFVFFGEGNIPWLVREIIRRNQPDERLQPRVVVG